MKEDHFSYLLKVPEDFGNEMERNESKIVDRFEMGSTGGKESTEQIEITQYF